MKIRSHENSAELSNLAISNVWACPENKCQVISSKKRFPFSGNNSMIKVVLDHQAFLQLLEESSSSSFAQALIILDTWT